MPGCLFLNRMYLSFVPCLHYVEWNRRNLCGVNHTAEELLELDEVCRLVGFTSATDYVTVINPPIFKEHAAAILNLTVEIRLLDGRQSSKSLKGAIHHSASCAMYRELRKCGHTFVACLLFILCPNEHEFPHCQVLGASKTLNSITGR